MWFNLISKSLGDGRVRRNWGCARQTKREPDKLACVPSGPAPEWFSTEEISSNENCHQGRRVGWRQFGSTFLFPSHLLCLSSYAGSGGGGLSSRKVFPQCKYVAKEPRQLQPLILTFIHITTTLILVLNSVGEQLLSVERQARPRSPLKLAGSERLAL